MTEIEKIELINGKFVTDEEIIGFLEKENADLKKKIERMKCCSNCNGIIYGSGMRTEKCKRCIKFSHWELSEEIQC